jgi:octaprenyl-diphosphate synthase
MMVGSTLNGTITRADAPTNGLLQLLQPVGAGLARVESALIAQVDEFDPGIGEYVRYVLGGSGKRLRPSLALLAGGATGPIGDGHISLGVIVELIHAATLVHDDVLDEARLRHGLPTANSRWGNEISVLVGDCLFAHALRLAAGFPSTEVCRRISQATNTVCAGEILQTRKRFDLELSIAEYLDIVRMKTGALFAVSCELGAALNDAPPAVVDALSRFGSDLGVAYQIFDDCVDIFGQERQAGKSLGTDMKKGKLTLPFLLLLGHLEAPARQQAGTLMFQTCRHLPPPLLDMVRNNGVIAESLDAIERYLARARASLDALSPGPHCKTLCSLLDYLTDQSRDLLRPGVAA